MGQFKVWYLQDDIRQYEFYLEKCLKKTPYHFTEYLLAEEEAEEEPGLIFLYEENGEFALMPNVIRKVNRLPYMKELTKNFWDMITPYEYGGIISNSSDFAVKRKLIEHMDHYCNSRHIVVQFVRVNPDLSGLPDIYRQNGYQLIHSCRQVYVDLRQTEEQIVKGYRSNVRRNIKRAEREGLRFEIGDKNSENIEIFQNMYEKAMELLEARRFLYFNERYFQKLLACNCSRLGLVLDGTGKVVAAGIMLLGQEIVYYHLGCFDRQSAMQRPMNYLIHSMILWSKKEGYGICHLGGGSRNLMQFKGGYSNTRIDYYTASKICDGDTYTELCRIWREQFPEFEDKEYFPMYRYNEDVGMEKDNPFVCGG